MKIPLAIVGHGKMGHLVEQLAPEYDFSVVARFNSSNIATLSRETLAGATTAIEFSLPSAAPENLRHLAALGVRSVCGTTGWYGELPKVQSSVDSAKTAFLYGPNFSIGVNLFFQIVSHAASLLARHPDYGAWGWEIHHASKKDAPSGTLKKLAEEIAAAGFSRPVSLSANRAGTHIGTHEIGFDSPGDTITLRHTARNRESYARGALLAARWLQGKTGAFEFRDILHELGTAKPV